MPSPPHTLPPIGPYRPQQPIENTLSALFLFLFLSLLFAKMPAFHSVA
jgi:hypothetical protein